MHVILTWMRDMSHASYIPKLKRVNAIIETPLYPDSGR